MSTNKNSLVVITGASEGIGFALSKELLKIALLLTCSKIGRPWMFIKSFLFRRLEPRCAGITKNVFTFKH